MVHHSPTPPSPPAASDDIAICRAWIDAEMNHPGDRDAVVALVETAVRRCLDRRAGRVGTHYEHIPAAIRPLVGRRDGEGLKALVGRWDRDANFTQGIAGLLEAEAVVWWWHLRGWETWEMQRELTAPRARQSREFWVRAEVVDRDLAEAQRKMARVFGLAD